jgi:hypothetical protein
LVTLLTPAGDRGSRWDGVTSPSIADSRRLFAPAPGYWANSTVLQEEMQGRL